MEFIVLNFVRSLHLNAYILSILLFDCLSSYRAFLQDVFFTTAYLQGSSGLLPWTMNESVVVFANVRGLVKSEDFETLEVRRLL